MIFYQLQLGTAYHSDFTHICPRTDLVEDFWTQHDVMIRIFLVTVQKNRGQVDQAPQSKVGKNGYTLPCPFKNFNLLMKLFHNAVI